jgi:hypothetical protein
MNKELHMEMENQGNLLETTRAEMEALKGVNQLLEGSLKMACFHFGMHGLNKGGNKLFLWKDLSQAEARDKGLRHVTDEQGLEVKKKNKKINTRLGGG